MGGTGFYPNPLPAKPLPARRPPYGYVWDETTKMPKTRLLKDPGQAGEVVERITLRGRIRPSDPLGRCHFQRRQPRRDALHMLLAFAIIVRPEHNLKALQRPQGVIAGCPIGARHGSHSQHARAGKRIARVLTFDKIDPCA